MAKEYDVTVLGGGPAGYVAAIRSAQLGKRTAIIERRNLGGVCLNVGCVPSKSLLKNAEVAHILKNRSREFGFSFDNLKLDYGVAFKRSRQVSQRMEKGVGFLMRKNKIDVYEGTGSITSEITIRVDLKDGSAVDITSTDIIVATGARPYSIPGVEIDGQKIITYHEAIMAEKLPEKAIIVGGGPIGVEFAYIWSNYGVDVTIVEMLDHLLPNEDPESSVILEKAYKKLGIKFHLSSRVEQVNVEETGVTVVLNNGDHLTGDEVLMAVGFRPNVEDIGLDSIGVTLDDNGSIAVDEFMRTNVANVYAIGDVVAPEGIMLAHIGSAMGIVAAESIAKHPTVPLDYRMLPRCTYSVPQVASFGFTEEQARAEGYELKVGRFPFQANGKALGLGEREGFIKIISDARYGEILGAHMVGPDVTELLPELTLAHIAELTAEEIARNVHAHPTLSEALMEAAHGVEGEPIHI